MKRHLVAICRLEIRFLEIVIQAASIIQFISRRHRSGLDQCSPGNGRTFSILTPIGRDGLGIGLYGISYA